jgi:hypothetical protein
MEIFNKYFPTEACTTQDYWAGVHNNAASNARTQLCSYVACGTKDIKFQDEKAMTLLSYHCSVCKHSRCMEFKAL